MTVKTFDELVAKVKSGKNQQLHSFAQTMHTHLKPLFTQAILWTPYSLLKRTSLTS